MKKDALVKKDEILITKLEADKIKNEADTVMLISQIDELKQYLEVTKPSINKILKWAAATISCMVGALVFSSPVLFMLGFAATVLTTVSFAKADRNKTIYAQLKNELKDREEGLIKLSDANLDIRFKLLEAKNPE